MPTNLIRVRDLFRRPRPAPNVEARQPMLHCRICGATYSADPGDYWNLPADYTFRCCRRAMRLVDREVRYIDARGRS